MSFELAPMEGITTWLFRQTLEKYFPGTDVYYTPFLAPIPGKPLKTKELREIDPELNRGIHLIPQILTNHPDTFHSVCEQLLAYGYEEINLNTGCPSGTVVARKKGSGMLGDPKKLNSFFERIFSENPEIRISVKTRIGLEDMEKSEELLNVFASYPFSKVIVHPRTRRQFYKGTPNLACFEKWKEKLKTGFETAVVYNGNLFTSDRVKLAVRENDGIMAGRGMIADPSLFQRAKGVVITEEEFRKNLEEFQEELLNGYRELYREDRNTLFKLKELWFYERTLFEGSEKVVQEMKKKDRMPAFRTLSQELIRNGKLRSETERAVWLSESNGL